MKLPIPKEYYKINDIDFNGKRIRTYSFGIGPQKIFSLPGFPHSGIIYLYLFLHYDLSKIQVVTLDIPGWIGHSQNIFKDSQYDENMVIDLIYKITKIYNFDEFNLIGYSFGTSLATKMIESQKFGIHKIALVSPILNGKQIKDKTKLFILSAIYKLKAYFTASMYLNSRFKKYLPVLQKSGMDAVFINEYRHMIKSFNPKVVISSLYCLFNSDYSEILKTFDPSRLLIASSRDESTFLRQQAEHIRRIVDGEKTLILNGNHEDFILKPSSETVKDILRFLNA